MWPLELGLGTHNPRFVAWRLELGLGTHNPRFVAWRLELGLGTHNRHIVAWPLELGLGTHNPCFVAWRLELGLGTHNPRFVAWPLELGLGFHNPRFVTWVRDSESTLRCVGWGLTTHASLRGPSSWSCLSERVLFGRVGSILTNTLGSGRMIFNQSSLFIFHYPSPWILPLDTTSACICVGVRLRPAL